MEPLKTLLQVSQYLAVSKETVYRLVKSGRLPGIRVDGIWRFHWSDVERFVCRRMRRYGFYDLKPFFFRPAVLKRYEAKPEEYYLHEEAFNGIFGERYALHLRQSNEPLKEGGFCEIPFWKVEVKKKVIVLDPKNLRQLPQAEQKHWTNYRIPDQDIEEIP